MTNSLRLIFKNMFKGNLHNIKGVEHINQIQKKNINFFTS